MPQRIVFINPPSPFLTSDRGAPPLGILWLAAQARQAGHEAKVWDMTGDVTFAERFGCDISQFFSRGLDHLPTIIENEPDETIFGITATSAQYEAARNILLALRWHNPHWQVIIGGPHASALPDAVARDGFDTVFAGEADYALPAWLDEARLRGVIHCNAPYHLDGLPMPARDLIDLPSYCSNLTVGEGLSSTIHCSRGCPFACAFCDRQLGNAARILRTRSVMSILNEVQHLDQTYGIRRFVATDDIFGIKRAWLHEWCEVFAQEPYVFRVNCRASTLHHDLLEQMRRAGVHVISFGFESGDDRVLNAISKNTRAANAEAVEACHDHGIAVKAYLIFGFAGDDADSVDATKRFIEETRPESAQCAWLVPLPGTPIYAEAIRLGWEPAYHQLYHNGKDRRGGMSRLPWHTDETATLYEDLCAWIEDFYQQPQASIECQNALGSGVIL